MDEVAFISNISVKRISLVSQRRTNICSLSKLQMNASHKQPSKAEKTRHRSFCVSPTISRKMFLKKLLLSLTYAGVSYIQPSNAEGGSTIGEIDKQKAIQDFREVTGLQDLAFEYTNRFDFENAEIIWTKIISLNENNAAAYSNRGNCRTSQGKFDEAVSDFDRAIALASDEPDPYLGKGVALEGMNKYQKAFEAYQTANNKSMSKYNTSDAVALNNMGNALGSLGDWNEAFKYYKKAADMDSHFVFALANEALAMYQIGDDKAALKKMRFLTRKYPRFGDMHAAIAMAMWDEGNRSAAEDAWFKAISTDPRYDNILWVREIRRWPPRLLHILEKFKTLT